MYVVKTVYKHTLFTLCILEVKTHTHTKREHSKFVFYPIFIIYWFFLEYVNIWDRLFMIWIIERYVWTRRIKGCKSVFFGVGSGLSFWGVFSLVLFSRVRTLSFLEPSYGWLNRRYRFERGRLLSFSGAVWWLKRFEFHHLNRQRETKQKSKQRVFLNTLF